MTDKNSDKMQGTAWVLTGRYQLPIAALNRPKIGAEWFQGSKRAYLYDAANVNPINMYASPNSDVYHAFYSMNFDGGLALNTGYFYRKQRSQYAVFNLIGKDQGTDNIDQNVYVSLLATF